MTSVGAYLAARLHQLGVRHFFGVPGDYNLALLDQFEASPLGSVYCCNELNAGYAADGYARATGLAAMVVTFNCGAFSAVNAIAGAYAEDLPVVLISGGPNSNSLADKETLHHTIDGPRFDYQRRMFAEVTVASAVVDDAVAAPVLIDRVLATALREHRPVYLEIAANVAALPCADPVGELSHGEPWIDAEALAAAVDAAADRLNGAVKPVLVGGARLRAGGGIDAFSALSDSYALAAMPDAKGMVDEQAANYIGTYWGPVSSPGVASIIEGADAYLFAGPVFSDYTTAGHSALIHRDKLIEVGPTSVHLPGQVFDDVPMAAFLTALAPRLRSNTASLDAFRRIRETIAPTPARPGDPLTTRQLRQHLPTVLSDRTTLLAETGDSWFNAIKTGLPASCGFEIQMKYGSIGWSVGATLGYSLGSDRRVVALIGDGSFQMTAQELSTIIRYRCDPIIILINNGGYTIEVEIHDGPYNVINNWDYAAFANAVAGEGSVLAVRVATVGEFTDALARAADHRGPVLIEAVIGRDDCTSELLEWGSRVATNNGRPPRALSATV